MNSMRKYLPIALLLGFTIFGLDAFFQSRPTTKNARVYKSVQKYSPYYFEKRFGGLQIKSKEDPDFKEEPTNTTLFTEFERLEKLWGQTHLKIENSTLIISDDDGVELDKLPLNNKEEIGFAHSYYGI